MRAVGWTRLPLAAVAVFVGAAPGAAQPRAEDVLRLAGAYVERFVDQVSNVVAEEHYVQEAARPPQRRTLRSDFLLVRYPGATRWHAFRDVLEVDGRPVGGNRTGRLAALFLEAPVNALARATEIARAGDEHHLLRLDVYNNPLLVLSFLQPADQSGFRFTRAGLDRDFVGPVRVFGFEMTTLAARARQYIDRRAPIRGRVWIDETTGRVPRTEFETGSPQAPLRLTTSFARHDALGIDVPTEMRYVYLARERDERGVATYTNFRRFQVRTEVQ